jgi:dipeptidyl aminopeptidase/acylaminoacyl peptidase
MKKRALAVIFLTALLGLSLLAVAAPWSQAEPLPVPYTLPDGTRLTGYLSLPPTYQSGQKYPAILLIHGGKGLERNRPGGQSRRFLKSKPVQENLCPKYVVFSATYASEYFADPREFASMAAALKAMTALPQVDPQRIAALGVSHGGYLALMCAAHPDITPKPRAAVSISGVVEVATFTQHLRLLGEQRKGGRGAEFFPYATTRVAQALGWPPDKDQGTRENYARVSVLTYVPLITAPLLVIHGTGDNLVPFSQARSLRQALEKEKKNFEFLEVPTGPVGGHFIFASHQAVWEKIEAFFNKYL